jgi:signal transduction histidine kinase
MLHEFLVRYREEILQLCRTKVLADGESKPTSDLLGRGLPVFYDELAVVLNNAASDTAEPSLKNEPVPGDAAAHGKESLRLGYSVSQVVRSYGAVCQSIMEFVQTKSFEITAAEFQSLNLSLDLAIAEAVTEFEKMKSRQAVKAEAERLGVLIHEMGNALTAATLAHQMIQKGRVGGAGMTSNVLSRSHDRMWGLIRSAEAEVHLRGGGAVKFSRIRLTDITDEIRTAADLAANLKEVRLEFDVDPAVEFTADPQLLFSALSNLVNNAVKFTPRNGSVKVSARISGERVLIEVEDECGGLPDGKIEELFKPYVQKGSDKSGMGLGLPLSLRAVESNRGTLTARNKPGKGCVFTIDLPRTAP